MSSTLIDLNPMRLPCESGDFLVITTWSTGKWVDAAIRITDINVIANGVLPDIANGYHDIKTPAEHLTLCTLLVKQYEKHIIVAADSFVRLLDLIQDDSRNTKE